MEKYARYALLHQDQRFKIAVREYQRPARDAVNQAERIFGKITKLRCSKKFKVSRIDKMEEDEVRVAQMVWVRSTRTDKWCKKECPSKSARRAPKFELQKILVELWEALIDKTASSDKCLLLGVPETLRLLSLHLFSGLCVRVLNSAFSSGTSETLPSHPCLCLCLSPM